MIGTDFGVKTSHAIRDRELTIHFLQQSQDNNGGEELVIPCCSAITKSWNHCLETTVIEMISNIGV